MAEEKEKEIEKDLGTKPPAGTKRDELSEKDFEKVAGGAFCQYTTTRTDTDDCR
jgi:hypothetical protein